MKVFKNLTALVLALCMAFVLTIPSIAVETRKANVNIEGTGAAMDVEKFNMDYVGKDKKA